MARCCSATVKDVEGIPDAAGAARSRVTVAELRETDPTTLPVDAIVLDLLERAEHVREIRIVNGLVPGALTAALGGLAAGTTVHAG